MDGVTARLRAMFTFSEIAPFDRGSPGCRFSLEHTEKHTHYSRPHPVVQVYVYVKSAEAMSTL
jgi:hypothetical protein